MEDGIGVWESLIELEECLVDEGGSGRKCEVSDLPTISKSYNPNKSTGRGTFAGGVYS